MRTVTVTETRPAGPSVESKAIPFALLAAAVALWLWSLARVDLDRLSDIGLITALPATFLLAVCLLTVGFFCEVMRPHPRPHVLWAYLVAAVVFLHGVTGAVEVMPRFSTSWIHAGFTNHIADHNVTLPLLDARFSWPGFFTVAALVQRVAGLESALWFVRWAPVLVDLMVLLPVAVLVRVAAVPDRARWTALWLFCIGNWVGQDYFSPQALNFFLYLSMLAVLLRYFRPAGGGIRLPLLSRFPSLEEPPASATPGVRGALVVVMVGLAAASTVSHQLTPFAMAVGAGALVVAGRCTLRLLPVLFGVLAVAWLSFAAEPYWIGHLGDVTGGVGKLGTSLQSGVADRLDGSTGHVFVLRLRMVVTAVLWAVAAAGVVRSIRRNGGVPWPHVLLAGAPLSLVALQSYGGEILLRVYMFSLPFMALLAALAFFPSESAGRTREAAKAVATLTVVSLLATAAFLVIRYGNERFEYFTEDEVAAVDWVYLHAAPGSQLVALNPQVAWRDQDVTTFSYVGQIDHRHLDEAEEILSYLTPRSGADGYLLMTRSQEAYGEMAQGEPRGWTADVERMVVGTGEAEVVFRNDDATVIRRPGGVR
jgi:hypothetical protein